MHQADVADLAEDEGVVVVEDLEVEVEVIEVVEAGEVEEFAEVAFNVAVVAVVLGVVEGEGVVVGVQGEEAGEEEKVDPIPSLNPTDTPGYSSQKAKIICWSPRISYQESRYMARSGYLSTVGWGERKSNTGSGILSEASWLLVFLEVLTIFLSNLARKYCILVLPVVQVSVMSLT